MEIKIAEASQLGIVKDIAHRTIKAVYPRYYPAGAVDFFLAYHSDEHIMCDIRRIR